MKKQLKRFFSKMNKLHLLHPDDLWNEIKIANNYKRLKRKQQTKLRNIK